MKLSAAVSCTLAALVVGGLWGTLSPNATAQLASSFPPVGASWPPKPRNIVSLDSRAFGSGQSYASIAANSTLPLAAVPNKRWLLITDYDASGSAAELIEDATTGTTVKRGGQWVSVNNLGTDSDHSAVGMSFAPGSQLSLRNTNLVAVNFTFRLNGYWVTR